MKPEILLLAIRLLIAASLYAFLAAVIWVLWRQLSTMANQDDEIPDAYLLMLGGGQMGERFRLRQTADVGRAVGNAIRLQDEAVSAQHARMSYQGGQWWVEDFASRNGTMVNGIQVTEPLVITYGDEIQFGRTVGRLERGEAAGVSSTLTEGAVVNRATQDELVSSKDKRGNGG
jgi:pSer/pThr/pTyr-binding forkhead associated (FHA) protein